MSMESRSTKSRRRKPPDVFPHLLTRALPDFEPSFLKLFQQCKPFTMTSAERMYALHKAVEYVSQNKLPGDIVECGVYKGGSSMLSALTLQACNDTQRSLYLYDTFTGMSEPTDKDKTHFDQPAEERWKDLQTTDVNKWCYASLEDVRTNMYSTHYPREQLHFIKGKVEETIPQTIPDKISLLRLDTDWYESTYHELCHLFPRLCINGVIIIDDYGHWKGAREAVDQYVKENNIKLLFNRIDYTGRIAIKTKP